MKLKKAIRELRAYQGCVAYETTVFMAFTDADWFWHIFDHAAP